MSKKNYFLKKVSETWSNFGIITLSTFIFLTFLEIGARTISVFSEEKNTPKIELNWDLISIKGEDRPYSLAYKGEESWTKLYVKEIAQNPSGGLVYEPFSLWKSKPYKTKYKNYNSDGYRNTINKTLNDSCTPKKIYFYGGSTTAGDGLLRDQDTIPSIVSSNINKKGVCTKVYNYAQSGFNSGNEFTLFTNQIIDGNIPKIAVFYDGINDTVQKGLFNKPHMAYDIYKNAHNISSLRVRLVEAFLRRSYLASYLTKGYLRGEETPKTDLFSDLEVIRRSQNAAKDHIKKSSNLNNICNSFKIKCIFILQSSIFDRGNPSYEEKDLLTRINKYMPKLKLSLNEFNKTIKEFNKKQNQYSFSIVDMTSVLDISNTSFFIDHAHVSPRGNQIIGREIAELILNNNYLKNK